MSSTIKVNNISNLAGDDSGIDLSTNDQVIIKTANTSAITVNASQATALGGNLTIPNGGTIGSVGDIDAMTISSGGVVTFANTPVGAGGGAILKVVHNTYTTTTTINNTTADTGLSCAITPTESNSLLMITVSLHYAIYDNGGFAFITDSSNNMIQQPPADGSRSRTHFGTHYASAERMTYDTLRSTHTVFTTHSGTSAQTFKVRVTVNAGTTFYLNRNKADNDRLQDPRGISTMIIQEIAQ